jgi:hypothetical protein
MLKAKNHQKGIEMKNSAGVVRYFLIYILFIVLGVWRVGAQVADPTKALIGTWDGWIEGIGNGARAIAIRSLTPKEGGGWTADGRFGFTADKMGSQPMDVSLKGEDIIVEFTLVKAKNPVRLKLIGDNKLEGTINIIAGDGSRVRGVDRSFKFEKVPPKAGDVR